MRVLFFILSGALLTGCAQRLDDVDEKITDLQKRTANLEVKGGGSSVGSGDRDILEGQKIADVRSQLATIKNEVTVLAGKIEALEYDNKRLSTRLEASLQDNEQKIRELSKQRAAAPVVGTGSPDAGGKEGDSEYDRGLKAHQDGDFAQAEKLFLDYIKKNPKSSLTDNAIFWVGDGYLAQKQYKKAIAKFQDLIDRFPKSDKKCEAMGNQIIAFKELGMDKEAKVFTQVKESECK